MKSFVAVLVALCGTFCLADAPAETPNVVLIVADHMGASDIRAYGAADIATPSLDTLAAQGVRFTDYYAAAPICGPSRAAMLTGKYPARIDFEDNVGDGSRLSARLPTLPALLKQRGYANGHFGKWHLGDSGETDPLAHGFDEFLGYHHWSVNHYTHKNDNGEESLTHNRSIVERDGYLTDILTDESIRFMEENRDGPFFLYLAYNTALPPYLGPGLPPRAMGCRFQCRVGHPGRLRIDGGRRWMRVSAGCSTRSTTLALPSIPWCYSPTITTVATWCETPRSPAVSLC